MPRSSSTLNRDHEDIVNKFGRLLEDANALLRELDKSGGAMGPQQVRKWFAWRTMALNLISRTAGKASIYFRSLAEAQSSREMQGTMPAIQVGILEAALTDFREGFMIDTKLLVSAEVFADFLEQAMVLLEHDYKDAAAVIIRAVLEDGLRRVCLSRGLVVGDRAGVDELARLLANNHVINAIQQREIDAKRALGNAAAHGRFGEYTKKDVEAFHEFVQRLLATLI